MKNIIITLSENSLDNIYSIADQLRKEGMQVTGVFDFGVISGKAENSVISKIKKHKDIISLTEEKQANLPPPGSDVQ